MKNIFEVMQFAMEKHNNSKTPYRKTARGGTQLPYIFHPMSVAQLVWKWGAGTTENMYASLCHDLVEDCGVTEKELLSVIGPDATARVMRLSFVVPEDQKANSKVLKEEYLKTFFCWPKGSELDRVDVDTSIIKLADRLKNVMDFALTDPVYALKYFNKANSLITGLNYDRCMDIQKIYNDLTYKDMNTCIEGVKEILSEYNEDENIDYEDKDLSVRDLTAML